MAREPLASIVAAIAHGRGSRGEDTIPEWTLHRALVLSSLWRGLTRARIGGQLGISAQQVTLLTAEACEAVLRGGAASPEAEAVCARRWQRWCDRGDRTACDRCGGSAPGPVPHPTD
jgi:hypothetical protein